MAQVERLDRVGRALSDHVELALQRILIDAAAPRATNTGGLPLHFLGAHDKPRIVGRHVAPTSTPAPRRDRALDLLLAPMRDAGS